jgi:hypothetical protein
MGINMIKRKGSDFKYNINNENNNYGSEKKNKNNANVVVITTTLAIPTYLWLYSPLLDIGRFFNFLILYTVGRTPWTVVQPVARLLPTHRTNIHRHSYLESDSNPRFQRSSWRRQFIT